MWIAAPASYLIACWSISADPKSYLMARSIYCCPDTTLSFYYLDWHIGRCSLIITLKVVVWCAIEDWFLNKFNIPIICDRQATLFVKYNKRNLYTVQILVMLIDKWYIFASPKTKCLCCEKNPTYFHRFYIEQSLLLTSCKYTEYEKYWQNICDVL